MTLFQTEFSYKANPKALDQFQYCEQSKIPLAVVIGQDEVTNNVVLIKDTETREQVDY